MVARTSMNRFSFAERTTRWPSSEESEEDPACRYLEGQLAVALGGRVAEELIYGEEEITTGASNDLQQVAAQARANL